MNWTRARRRWLTVAAVVAIATVVAAVVIGTLNVPEPSATSSTPRVDVARVVAVVDGDTIDVQLPDGKARVRLLGIDTPEIGRRGAQDECYAAEARTILNDLVYGRDVDLHTDPSQGDVDAYGRLLRQVLTDGQDAALTLLQAGAGTEFTFRAPYATQATYKAAENTAKTTHRGLWGECERQQ